MFKRKAYAELLEWKNKYCQKYAALIEGARRVGKSTLAEEFARNEFESYILIDFGNVTEEILRIFDDISQLDIFFLRLQAVTGVDLIVGKSVIIFDEIQLFPKARQAIKYLVKDGRYAYIETGSLISIKKNVKNILIPSEEHKINLYPMDYEEFLWACEKQSWEILEEIERSNISMGNAVNRKLMRDFRIYLAVGGMPQAVQAYVDKENFNEIDRIKREIIELYKNDFYKIDSSGRISKMYDAIPSQLASNKKRYVISNAIGKRTTEKDKELLSDLIDSKTVLISYNTNNVNAALSQCITEDSYKMYLSDTGLFTTLLFNNEGEIHTDIYAKLLSDKLDTNLGYLYENAVAQIISSLNKNLYYHTWQKESSTHYFEIDFLLTSKSKVIPIEVKSASIKSHKSMDAFVEKYSSVISRRILFSQKDLGNDNMLELKPLYLAPLVLKRI